MKSGLVLSGGGARGAYQVGVLKAMAELLPKHTHNPFSIISGTSSGAINAVALAASANNFQLAVKKVERIWRNLHVDQVYESGVIDLLKSCGRLVGSMFNQGIGTSRPLALLNTDPLRELLSHTIQFKNIQKRIDEGYLEAVSVTASGYTSGESVSFFQGNQRIKKWRKTRSVGVPALLDIDHLLASSAIPTILPAQKISREYFGDGALRQLSPISPVIHMGADRIFVIGVSGHPKHLPKEYSDTHSPSLAHMVGHVYKCAFIDSLEADIEHLVRVNSLVKGLKECNQGKMIEKLRYLEFLAIEPSIQFDEIADKHVRDLPAGMRAIMKITGATGGLGGASMASYLLFESAFCQELIDYGYQDAMEQEAEILAFLG
ncbi:MAG: patatin-like phospholipase family protein [Pseudomonadales bacterium]|nr:patatin-like phospholipase family protein [Pseudomonadales bacterium]MCP5213910.1 patatin-like phospholipase family protein [Pseudomonadales bacterium]MCP5302880.1 patatin-like phospholipase family protein [Pseudomonadales bacterium]